jgi:co-chaperonin GroES (HSP10)
MKMTYRSDQLTLNQYVSNMSESLITYEGRKFNTAVNTVLVRMDKHEKVTPSGIIIPSTAKMKTDFSGVVAAVSRGIEKEGIIKVGERVIVTKQTKRVLPTDDPNNEYRLFNRQEVFIHGL